MNKREGAPSETLVSMDSPPDASTAAPGPATTIPRTPASVARHGSDAATRHEALISPSPENDSRERPAWVTASAGALLALSTVVFLLSLAVGFYNVRYSAIRISEIGAEPTGAVAETSTREFPATFPEWVHPYLQDLSVVSPALVAFTAASMILGSVWLLWFPAAVARASSIHFPFPDSYKTYYIQFGLLGTIVGFVIAFSDIDLGAERQTLVLIEALGTALWSTLTALLLSYGVCPLFELAYRRLRDPLARRHPSDTRSALELLRQRTSDAAESLTTLRRTADAMSAELNLHQLESRVGRVEGSLSQIVDDLTRLTKAVRGIETGQEEIANRARSLAGRADRTDAHLGDVDRRLDEISRSLGALTGTAEDLGRQITQLRERDLVDHTERLDEAERRLDTIVRALKNVAE